MNILNVMRAGPVIAVLVIEELAQAVPLIKALVAGGARVLEVTLHLLSPQTEKAGDEPAFFKVQSAINRQSPATSFSSLGPPPIRLDLVYPRQ